MPTSEDSQLATQCIQSSLWSSQVTAERTAVLILPSLDSRFLDCCGESQRTNTLEKDLLSAGIEPHTKLAVFRGLPSPCAPPSPDGFPCASCNFPPSHTHTHTQVKPQYRSMKGNKYMVWTLCGMLISTVGISSLDRRRTVLDWELFTSLDTALIMTFWIQVFCAVSFQFSFNGISDAKQKPDSCCVKLFQCWYKKKKNVENHNEIGIHCQVQNHWRQNIYKPVFNSHSSKQNIYYQVQVHLPSERPHPLHISTPCFSVCLVRSRKHWTSIFV